MTIELTAFARHRLAQILGQLSGERNYTKMLARMAKKAKLDANEFRDLGNGQILINQTAPRKPIEFEEAEIDQLETIFDGAWTNWQIADTDEEEANGVTIGWVPDVERQIKAFRGSEKE